MAVESCISACLFLEGPIIQTCEHSLYGTFAVFLTSVSQILSTDQQPSVNVIMEYRIFADRKYAVDRAVVLKGRNLVVVYELKQKVAPTLEDQSDYDVFEFFVQCFHISTVNSQNSWFCLTDLKDFHYFKFKEKSRHLEIDQYFYLKSNLCDFSSTNEHMCFVKEKMSC